MTSSKESILSPNLQLLADLGLQKVKEIYEEGQSALDMLLQTIKALDREGQADKELTEKYRNMLEQQVELAKFIKEKEKEEQIKQVMKKHESVQNLLEMLKERISSSTSATQAFLTTSSSQTPLERTPIPSSIPEPTNFELLNLPAEKLSQLDLTTLKNIFEPVDNKRRTLEEQIRQQVKKRKQVDPTLQEEYQYLVSLQTNILLTTKNFSEEKLSQLPPTSGLACRLQEIKAISQVLKKNSSFPKSWR